MPCLVEQEGGNPYSTILSEVKLMFALLFVCMSNWDPLVGGKLWVFGVEIGATSSNLLLLSTFCNV